MSIVTIHQAKTNLSRLIEKASEGEEVIIARGSKPVETLGTERLPVDSAGDGLGRGRSSAGTERTQHHDSHDQQREQRRDAPGGRASPERARIAE